MIAERAIDWAQRRAIDRVVAVGRLAVRPLRYVADGATLTGPTIPRLRVALIGWGEVPIFHAETGVYGFLRVPAGPRRIEITDPGGRWLPAVGTATVPDRSALATALGNGGSAPVEPLGGGGRPLWLIDVAVRPGVAMPTAAGLTTVWGVVRESGGDPVPLARIACATAGGATVTTFADAQGNYVVALPAERFDPLTNTAVFDRAIVVHSPRPPLLAAIARATRLIDAMPTDIATLDPDAADSPFRTRIVALVAPGSAPRAVPLPVRVAQRARWDIVLQP